VSEREGNKMTIDHYHNYCEHEYIFVKNCMTRKNPFVIIIGTPREIEHNALQRLLGAGDLAQQMGVPYEEVEQEYNFYVEKIKKVCETP
jgi:hypothetical protein